MEAITSFDQVPAALNYLINEVLNLKREIKDQSSTGCVIDRWFSIEELSEYIPGHPAVTTLYGKVQRREIPFSRQGKRLVFLQSEIDAWLQSGRVKTSAELDILAEQFISSKRKVGQKGA